jgi:hypothetical protein
MSIETMTKIDSYTVGAGGIASVTFSNIPQHYTDLKIVISARDTNANSGNFFANIVMLLNSDSNTQNYGWTLGYSLSGTMAAISTGLSGGYYVIYNPSSSATASTFGNSQTTILNYSSNRYKPISDESQAEGNSLATFLSISTGIWRNTSPVTSLTFQSMTLFAQHSTITVYGVQSMKKAIGNSIKATGGAISFDGTYVYHTFNTSDFFTPTASLVADYLVVAGGGGGGNRVAGNGGGGGGGAGGLRTSVGLTQMLVNPSSYTVTVGAGGAINASGSNSSFSSIAASGGGYGGNNGTPYAGASGGSGGGSIRSDSGITVTGGAGNAGGYSPVEGYAGGSGSGPGGGGGGAGAVGTNSGASGGDGGVGVTSSLSGTARYYAGGGGGAGSGVTGNNYGAGLGGLGGGGNGGGSNGLPSAGTANTGGGGGGQQFYPNTTTGGAGGSGIVIIRYKA